MSHDKHAIAQEAARVICAAQLTDYAAAKRKALERLGLPTRTALPDNAAVQQAVLEYQRLFGGDEYHEHLRAMRTVAVRVMRLLAEFSPRLAGGAVSGAVTAAHHVQLHLFADKAEMLDVFLHERGIRFEQDERQYRYPDGSVEAIPLTCFEVDGLGVDAAVFPEGEMKRPPVNITDGQLYKRLTLDAVETLIASIASPTA